MNFYKSITLGFLFLLISGILLGQSQTTVNDATGTYVVTTEMEHNILSPLKLTGDDSDDFIIVIPNPKNNIQGNGAITTFAVPVNNSCGNATVLTVDAPCINGTTKESNMQSGEATACQGTLTQSVWYRFVATSTSMYVEIERTASSGCYLSSAVYSGTCLPANGTVISCEDAAFGPNLNIHNLTGLTVGNTYRIQVGYRGGQVCGNNNNVNTGADFCIKVGTTKSCATCNSNCGPLCIYPTQPTVAQVVANCTQYILEPRLNSGQTQTQCYTFNAVATSFSLQMIINASGCSGGNVSSFNWTLYPSNCGSVIQSGNLSNMNAAGLTIGTNYTMCYNWTASCQHNSVYPYIVATSPLPIKLLHFDGNQEGNGIVLNWVTTSEINNSHFSVQRSTDGSDFTELAKITGAGNSNHALNYSFVDSDPLVGINYYRLVQYDFDNSSSASEIIAIRYNANFHLKIQNNPVHNNLELTVYSDTESQIAFHLLNSQGQSITSWNKSLQPGHSKLTLPLGKISKGSYLLRADHETGSKWIRLVKL